MHDASAMQLWLSLCEEQLLITDCWFDTKEAETDKDKSIFAYTLLKFQTDFFCVSPDPFPMDLNKWITDLFFSLSNSRTSIFPSIHASFWQTWSRAEILSLSLPKY